MVLIQSFSTIVVSWKFAIFRIPRGYVVKLRYPALCFKNKKELQKKASDASCGKFQLLNIGE